MLVTGCDEVIDGARAGALVTLCPVSFSIDGRGESESRFMNQCIGLSLDRVCQFHL
jgi:hypothetical protein